MIKLNLELQLNGLKTYIIDINLGIDFFQIIITVDNLQHICEYLILNIIFSIIFNLFEHVYEALFTGLSHINSYFSRRLNLLIKCRIIFKDF